MTTRTQTMCDNTTGRKPSSGMEEFFNEALGLGCCGRAKGVGSDKALDELRKHRMNQMMSSGIDSEEFGGDLIVKDLPPHGKQVAVKYLAADTIAIVKDKVAAAVAMDMAEDADGNIRAPPP